METNGNESVEGQNVQEGVTPATPPPQSPTAEEQVKSLQAQLDTVKQEKERFEKGYKGLQTTVNKTTEELKRQSDLRSDIEALKETQKILAAMLQETKAVPEENLDNLPQGKKQDYLKQFEDVQKRVETKRQFEAAQTKGEEYRQKVEGLGLTNKDKAYFQIRNAVREGDFEYADHLIAEAEKEKKVPEQKAETPKEETPSDATVEAYLRKKGLLKTETVLPSGGNRSIDDIRKDYIAGKITDAKYEEECRARGVSPA